MASKGAIATLLGDNDFEFLTDEELAEYVQLLETAVGETWSLTAKQAYADELWAKVDWMLFGGAAGGAKSELALHHANRLSLEIPGHSTLLLRRSIPELRRSLIIRLIGRIQKFGIAARYRKVDGQPAFHYPNRSIIECGHCQTEEAVGRYLSAEYDCVADGTSIIMADGTTKMIHRIKAGDMVATLEGPRPVTWCGPVGRKEAVTCQTYAGSVTSSLSHRFLAGTGWIAPAQCQERHVSIAGERSDYGESGGARRARRLLLMLTAQAVLYGPDLRTDRSADGPPHARARALDGSESQGCQASCSPGPCSCDERSPSARVGAPARTPSRAGAAQPAVAHQQHGGRVRTPTRSPADLGSWPHPYTMEDRPLAVDVHQAEARIFRVGERAMWDMTVQGANHYVSSAGMIHQNCIIIDEATTLSENQITQVASRLRTTRDKVKLGARPHLGLFTNPGGMSHAWFYDLFITPTNYGQKIVVFDISQGLERKFVVAEYEAPVNVADADADTIYNHLLPWVRSLDVQADPATHLVIAFVPSKATDNPFLDPSYLKNLNTLDERRRRQLSDGDWDTFEGMYFHEFTRATHVIQPFAIPETWQKARGIDFGSTAPYACLWCAWDDDGTGYIYREDYAANLTPQEQARRIKERSVDLNGKREKYRSTVADPSVFSNHRGVGKTIADMWRDAGLPVTRAKNQRVAGWTNVRQYLWDHELAKPRLFVFDSCTNLARTLPLAQHDEHRPEDLDTHGDDHALDALRYVLALRPISEIHRQEQRAFTPDARFGQMLRKLDKRKRRL